MISDPEQRDERVMTLAEKALETPLHERDSFLQGACQNDLELYRAVSEVVAWEERMSRFLSRPLIEFVDLDALEKGFEPGQIVSGRFEIGRRVGDGGMGVVYEAFDRKRQQRIAIKFAKPGYGRLLSPELEGALRVSHQNICRVNEIHTTGTEFGELDFLTMEFLDGETLSNRLARGKLDDTEAVEVARQLCSGVAAAHQSGVLHRDLKPGNIILCRNDDGITRAVITDFGLSTPSATPSEVGGGTPSYMAPELLRDGKPSQASDVFALGVILYEMVVGHKPFTATTEAEGRAHPPIDPSKLVKNLPRRWNRAILPCLQANPEERCSAQAILNVLGHKPFYLRPAPLVAMAACLVVGILLVPTAISIFKPPSIRLAVLPAEASGDLAQRSREILNDVAERVKQLQVGKATASVIPLSKTLAKGVTTPQEAAQALGATHALQLKLFPETDGLVADAVVIDLRTMTPVRDNSGYFGEADLDDLRTGITGLVSWALHLHRSSQHEAVAPTAETAYKLGRAYLEREARDVEGAIAEFEEAARLDPHSPLPAAGLAEAHARKYQARRDEKTNQDVRSWLARAEALNPDSSTVRLTSGLLHTIWGDYAGALEDYQRVEEIEPNNMEAWLGSGLAYQLQGRLDKATTDYTQAISVAPNNYKPYEYMGGLYFRHGDYEKAEEMYKKSIEYSPDRAGGYADLGAAYTAQAKYFEAEKTYNASLELWETALTLNDIGVALAFEGRQREAMLYYRRAVLKDPTVSFYWFNLGDAQRRLHDQANAKDSYRRSLALALLQVTANPANPSARADLAYAQARLGLKKEARLEIAAALNSPAIDDQVLLRAIWIYEALGERDRALAAAAIATPQTRIQINHHPDLAGLQGDPRFKQLRAENK